MQSKMLYLLCYAIKLHKNLNTFLDDCRDFKVLQNNPLNLNSILFDLNLKLHIKIEIYIRCAIN